MTRYFPIMRTKAGEATALRHLIASARAKITPIINIVTTPSPGYAASLTAAWAGQSAALDGSFNYGQTGSVAAFNAMFPAIGHGGVLIVPSITLNDPPVYLAAVQAVVGMFAPGLVVQTSLGNLAAAAGWVTAAGWATGDVDLVINAGDVSNYDTATFGNYVASTINPNVVAPNQWRSISLHAYSAPRDHGSLAPGFNIVRRLDWLLWQHVHPIVGYELGYSDCGQVHAAMEEVPGAAMASATVSVRYAIDDNWVIRKGVRTNGPNGLPMGQQYRAHARALVAHPQFNAVAGCWADTEIRRYAAVPVGGQAGGRTQWSSIGMNRHLSLVADRLP